MRDGQSESILGRRVMSRNVYDKKKDFMRGRGGPGELDQLRIEGKVEFTVK